MMAAHIELDFARQLDDGFGMVAVFRERVFDGLGAIDEQAAIEAVLFLGHPLTFVVPADEDKRESSRAARGRLDEFHVRGPCEDRAGLSRRRLSVNCLLGL